MLTIRLQKLDFSFTDVNGVRGIYCVWKTKYNLSSVSNADPRVNGLSVDPSVGICQSASGTDD